MKHIRSQEEPLTKRNDSLMRELEANGFPRNFETQFLERRACTRTQNGLVSLEMGYPDALHSALQGMMTLALEGGNNLRVLKPKDAKRWLDAYENGSTASGGLGNG